MLLKTIFVIVIQPIIVFNDSGLLIVMLWLSKWKAQEVSKLQQNEVILRQSGLWLEIRPTTHFCRPCFGLGKKDMESTFVEIGS